jgi:tRNA1Val (adenine37-N6)-methyltransferase
MANSYFRFKQFIIHQDKSAMKVCTDACLFGAWVAKEIENEQNIESVLDIGAGTGLLSLMLAQKIKGTIEAVEVNDAAAQQAEENFKASDWSNRINIYHCAIQEFNCSSNQLKYDVIISNPPFFESSLKSDDKLKNLAKHTAGLPFDELVAIVLKHLKDSGSFFLLLPFREFELFTAKASANGLFLHHQLHVQQSVNHTYFRTIGKFSNYKTTELLTNTIVIKQNDKQYSADFTTLLKDYYLYL